MNDLVSLLWTGTLETLYMTFFSTLFAYIAGLPLGVVLVITARDGIRPMPALNAVIGWIVNVGRSIPFVILMVAIIPFTRAIVGTVVGNTAAIVPLVVAAAPFVARLVESSLKEVDRGIVEASISMGATNFQIIWKVLLAEAIPSLIRGLSIATITILSYTAMAGAVGADGLGKLAISYGRNRWQTDILVSTVILLIVLVQVIQTILNLIARAVDKNSSGRESFKLLKRLTRFGK